MPCRTRPQKTLGMAVTSLGGLSPWGPTQPQPREVRTPGAALPLGPPYPPQGLAYWSDVAQDVPSKVLLPGLR